MQRKCLTFSNLILISAVCWFSPAEHAISQETASKPVLNEGFEGALKTMFCMDNVCYRTDFAGPSEEQAANGKRSFKIEATWTGHTWDEWWAAPLVILYPGDAKVRAKLRVERGRARLGHPFAEPTTEANGIVVQGAEVASPTNGWSQLTAFAGGTLDKKEFRQAALIYFRPDMEGRAVVYIDDVEIDAVYPPGSQAKLDARINAIKKQERESLMSRARPLLEQQKALVEKMDASRLDLPASMPQKMADTWQRLRESLQQTRSELDAEIKRLNENPSHDALQSVRRLLGLFEQQQLSCETMIRYAEAHAAEPYIVWIVNPNSNELVYPKRFPVPGIVGTELHVSACAGEYEPASFAVQALDDLHKVRAVPSDVKCRETTIPASAIDVRLVKCWWRAGGTIVDRKHPVVAPELLLKDPDFVQLDNSKMNNTLKDPKAPRDAKELQPVSIAAGELQQFWVTVHVAETARPGRYRGTIRLTAADAHPLELAMVIDVLPFHLEEPLLQYSIYYPGQLAPDDKPSIGSVKSESQYLAEMLNLKAHGITHPHSTGVLGKHLERALELRKQAGIALNPLYTLSTVHVGRQQSPEELEKLKKDIRALKNQVAKHGVKELYVYGQDEASGEELKKECKSFQAVHEAGAKVFTACYLGAFELVGKYLDLANFGSLEPREARKWHAAGHKVFSYANPQAGIREPETYRRNFGLALWKAGYDGAMNWTYQSTELGGNIYDDFDHPRYRDHVYTYPTMDGVIDTIQWEGFREGVDDVRYLTTLLKAIELSRNDPDKRKSAEEAQRWLDAMDIDGDLDTLRAGIVDRILRLQKH